MGVRRGASARRPRSSRRTSPARTMASTGLGVPCDMRRVRAARGQDGGEKGIRTPGTLAGTPDFESGTLGHSDISPPPKVFDPTGHCQAPGKAASRVRSGFRARESVIRRAPPGEMTEWPKVHDWKSCVLARVPRVRIPLSPPNRSTPPAAQSHAAWGLASGAVTPASRRCSRVAWRSCRRSCPRPAARRAPRLPAACARPASGAAPRRRL